MKKIIVIHPDKQHSFMLAKPFKDSNTIYKYITSVYDKKGSLTNMLTKILKGNFKKKLEAHKTPFLADGDVKQYCELITLFLFILVRIDKSGKWYAIVKRWRNKLFAKRVARYCKKNSIDVVISFDVLSAYLYKEISKQKLAITKILDYSAPYYPYVRKILKTEYYSNQNQSELDRAIYSKMNEYWLKDSPVELREADGYLVASDFTKRSLVESGADAQKVFKCTYGIDTSFFNADKRQPSNGNTLNCVYVGNITEQKGCRYLLEVIKKTEDLAIRFTFSGAYDLSNSIIRECYKHRNCDFIGYVLKPTLKETLLKSDIMVFPSLYDGFGFSVLEAMACGVVPICSRNAGASDLIEDGVNGFVVDAMDSDTICEKIRLLYQDREMLQIMGNKAAETAKAVTWQNYYSSVSAAVDSILNK